MTDLQSAVLRKMNHDGWKVGEAADSQRLADWWEQNDAAKEAFPDVTDFLEAAKQHYSEGTETMEDNDDMDREDTGAENQDTSADQPDMGDTGWNESTGETEGHNDTPTKREALGPQALRRVIDHMLILLEEYDGHMGMVEQPEVLKHMAETCQQLEKMLTDTENVHKELYPHLPLEHLEGMEDGTDDMDDMEDAEDMNSDEENVAEEDNLDDADPIEATKSDNSADERDDEEEDLDPMEVGSTMVNKSAKGLKLGNPLSDTSYVDDAWERKKRKDDAYDRHMANPEDGRPGRNAKDGSNNNEQTTLTDSLVAVNPSNVQDLWDSQPINRIELIRLVFPGADMSAVGQMDWAELPADAQSALTRFWNGTKNGEDMEQEEQDLGEVKQKFHKNLAILAALEKQLAILTKAI